MAQQVWFTSDTHFGHANIVKYSGRPFADVREMDEALVRNWNEVVKPGDVVYHVGDFALCDVEIAAKIVKRLVGQKYLVFGNHDKALRKDKSFLGHWIWAKDMADITVGSQRIVLLHYAMRVWNQSHRGAWQLHGHSHGSLREEPHMLQADVGVDCWIPTARLVRGARREDGEEELPAGRSSRTEGRGTDRRTRSLTTCLPT